MRLLVSVASAEEASAALEGGADVIDAKDPGAGALGPVASGVLQEICAVVNCVRPVTAALGDAVDEVAIERAAREYAAAGAGLVKAGFAGIASARRVATLTAAAVHGARSEGAGVVAVAYADARCVKSLQAADLVDVAATAGARGLLVDTADKAGPGLRALIAPPALAALVADAHRAGLLVALAGKLTVDDLAFVRDAGADIAGVRGAACEGGRRGRVTAQKVRELMQIVRATDADRSVSSSAPGDLCVFLLSVAVFLRGLVPTP
jgi:(5-formylfuran-3-yl)methyl phosphate synthase